MLSRFRWRTPVFQNTGSVARDHLASERTFLAWIRTGLGFVALGIALERFSQLDLDKLLPANRPQDPSSQQQHQQQQQQQEPGRSSATLTDRGPDEKLQTQMLVGALMSLGSGSIIYGTARYFSNLRMLELGRFKPAYHGAAVLAAAVAGLAGGVYGNARRRTRERAAS